jgi:Family of unknown function (DUF6226)
MDHSYNRAEIDEAMRHLPTCECRDPSLGVPGFAGGLRCLRMTSEGEAGDDEVGGGSFQGVISTGCEGYQVTLVNGIIELMNGNRWGAEGPPLEAYSRVTDPERFESLRQVAAELLDRLELEFDVERAEGYGLDPELEQGIKLARPSVTLVPRDAGATPILVASSTFPGIAVRFGRWCTYAFPVCGCDACDETAESEIERLKWLIENLTAGRFREAIRIPAEGATWQEWEFWAGGGSSAQKSQFDPSLARQLVAAGDRLLYEWEPWPKRR